MSMSRAMTSALSLAPPAAVDGALDPPAGGAAGGGGGAGDGGRRACRRRRRCRDGGLLVTAAGGEADGRDHPDRQCNPPGPNSLTTDHVTSPLEVWFTAPAMLPGAVGAVNRGHRGESRAAHTVDRAVTRSA